MTQVLLAWGPAATWAAVLFLLSEARLNAGPSWLNINDKVVHLGLYLVLGATLAWAQRHERRGSFLLFLFLGMVYGVLDEWHQSFVPGRVPSWGDWVADAAGVVLGFFLLRFYLRVRSAASGNDTNRND